MGRTDGAEPGRILVPPQATRPSCTLAGAGRTGTRDRGAREAKGHRVHNHSYHRLSYLQAMDDSGVSLLDQSVIKKGKEWRAPARAESGEMVQGLGAQTPFLSPWSVPPVRHRPAWWPRGTLRTVEGQRRRGEGGGWGRGAGGGQSLGNCAGW